LNAAPVNSPVYPEYKVYGEYQPPYVYGIKIETPSCPNVYGGGVGTIVQKFNSGYP